VKRAFGCRAGGSTGIASIARAASTMPPEYWYYYCDYLSDALPAVVKQTQALNKISVINPYEFI